MTDKSTYPRAFMTPAGKMVSVRAMARALQKCHANPDQEFTGWDWFSVAGKDVVRDFQRGLDDRINRREGEAA